MRNSFLVPILIKLLLWNNPLGAQVTDFPLIFYTISIETVKGTNLISTKGPDKIFFQSFFFDSYVDPNLIIALAYNTSKLENIKPGFLGHKKIFREGDNPWTFTPEDDTKNLGRNIIPDPKSTLNLGLLATSQKRYILLRLMEQEYGDDIVSGLLLFSVEYNHGYLLTHWINSLINSYPAPGKLAPKNSIPNETENIGIFYVSGTHSSEGYQYDIYISVKIL